jgi:hypothetical protein
MKPKAELKFEIEETITITMGDKTVSEFCPNCRETTVMAVPAAIAIATGSNEREIFRLIEAGVIHFVETRRLVICPSCLRRHLNPAIS